jgi:hypothetical protein
MSPLIAVHLAIVIFLTVAVSSLVLRRYAATVRNSMAAAGDVIAPLDPPHPGAPSEQPRLLDVTLATPASPAARAALQRERATRYWVAAAYLLPSAICGLLLAATTLWTSGIELSISRLIGQAGGTMPAAVPMIAISVAWPFWRAVLRGLALVFAIAVASAAIPMARHLLANLEFDLTYGYNALYSLQFAAISLGLPLSVAFATGIRKIRGVAPVVLALMAVLGLVPLFGARALRFLEAPDRRGMLLDVAPEAVMYLTFFLLAPAAGWVAWKALKTLSHCYEAKWFSDSQLIANMWWLIFVAVLMAGQSVTGAATWVLLLAGTISFLCFPVLSLALFKYRPRGGIDESHGTVLLLRLFGHTSRSERFFDRVINRWRLHGPVIVIGAPDLVARTLDPSDFLRLVTGRLSDSFITSRRQLDERLATVDLLPDPDGRYRVTEFWCGNNSWQATVIALMSRCDAVVMDVRGLTAARQGAIFELRQLAERLPAGRVVLVVDRRTDRSVIEHNVAAGSGTLRIVHAERNSPAALRSVFETLLDAAGHRRSGMAVDADSSRSNRRNE